MHWGFDLARCLVQPWVLHLDHVKYLLDHCLAVGWGLWLVLHLDLNWEIDCSVGLPVEEVLGFELEVKELALEPGSILDSCTLLLAGTCLQCSSHVARTIL